MKMFQNAKETLMRRVVVFTVTFFDYLKLAPRIAVIRFSLLALALSWVFVAGALPCLAGDIYRIQSTDGKKEITYEVLFGRGKSSYKWTAFCPDTKKFVYLNWRVEEKAPEPASVIWDARTGETVRLYRFPDCPHPLPVIGDIGELKVCPFTGDKNLKKDRVGVYD
jgi:hypothetical protein